MMNRLGLRAEGGFTLIELLVVIAIIGILAAIAIPQFSAYRRRGFDASVKSDLRNAATAQEAYFTDKNTYTTSVDDLKNKGYKQSDNVTITVESAGATSFKVKGNVTQGCSTGGIWTFDSTGGTITGATCS